LIGAGEPQALSMFHILLLILCCIAERLRRSVTGLPPPLFLTVMAASKRQFSAETLLRAVRVRKQTCCSSVTCSMHKDISGGAQPTAHHTDHTHGQLLLTIPQCIQKMTATPFHQAQWFGQTVTWLQNSHLVTHTLCMTGQRRAQSAHNMACRLPHAAAACATSMTSETLYCNLVHCSRVQWAVLYNGLSTETHHINTHWAATSADTFFSPLTCICPAARAWDVVHLYKQRNQEINARQATYSGCLQPCMLSPVAAAHSPQT
jgi:hypothetical protein